MDKYEVPRSSLTFGEVIGTGNFGRVYVAVITDSGDCRIKVAVKELKKQHSEEAEEDFLNEIKTMKKVGYHENIISLLGCCTLAQPKLIVMEYIGCGDLCNYLIRLSDLKYGISGEPQPKRLETANATGYDSST